MKIDLPKMHIIFEELLPATDEERGVYWFKSLRKDGIFIILAFSIYQSYVDIIVHIDQKTVAVCLGLENCSEIRILDEEEKILEMLLENNRKCYLSLLSNSIMQYSETK